MEEKNSMNRPERGRRQTLPNDSSRLEEFREESRTVCTTERRAKAVEKVAAQPRDQESLRWRRQRGKSLLVVTDRAPQPNRRQEKKTAEESSVCPAEGENKYPTKQSLSEFMLEKKAS